MSEEEQPELDETELKLQKQIAMGNEAAAFLKNPLWVRARKQISDDLYRAYCNTKHSQKDEREEIYQLEQIHKKYLQMFERAVGDGKIAEQTLLQRLHQNVRAFF